MAMMKAVRIRFGGPEVMEIEDVLVPQPQDDEVLVRVHAASVTSASCAISVPIKPSTTRRSTSRRSRATSMSSSISSPARPRIARGQC